MEPVPLAPSLSSAPEMGVHTAPGLQSPQEGKLMQVFCEAKEEGTGSAGRYSSVKPRTVVWQ